MSRTFDLSPDGRWIVFAPWGGKHDGLFLFDLVAREVCPLTAPEFPCYHPTFTPDGKSVVYSRSQKRYDEQSALWRVELASGVETQLTSETRHFHICATLTPDGTRIVFMRSRWIGPSHTAGDIFSVRADGTQLTRHTHHDYRCSMNPHVALDNDTVAFWASDPFEAEAPQGIATISLSAIGEPEYIYTEGHAVSNPRFAPQGSGFAFVGDPVEFRYELFYAATFGGPARPLGVFKKSGTSPRDPAFSPDGKTIYFLNDSSLWRIQTDGTYQECVVDGQLFSDPPNWRASRHGCLTALALHFKPGNAQPL